MSEEQKKTGLVSLGDIVGHALDLSQKKLNQSEQAMGIKSGMNEFDNILGGFQPPDFTLIAARPGIGKTALIINLVAASLFQKRKSILFSLEMSNVQMVQRMMVHIGRVDGRFLRHGGNHLSSVEIDEIMHRLCEAAKFMKDNGSNLMMNDNHDVPIDNLIKMCMEQEGVHIIFVDYIQLVKGSSESKHRDRHIEVGEVSRKLKGLAKDMNVPIVAAAQLRRIGEGRQKKPVLGDLRESGSLEQDADQVVMLHRDLDEDGGMSPEGEALLMVQKNRHGETGTCKMFYRGRFFSFDAIPDLSP